MENIFDYLKYFKKWANVVFLFHSHYFSLNGSFNYKTIYMHDETKEKNELIFYFKKVIPGRQSNFYEDLLALGSLYKNNLKKHF